jgi:hypothetical protein
MSQPTLLGRAILLVLTLVSLPVLADPLNPLTGTYYGSVSINTPSVLGTVDLAIYLDVGPGVSGTTIQHDTSYIVLEKTLVFPQVTTLGGKAVGPQLTGTIGTGNILTVDQFTSKLADNAVNRGGAGLDNLVATRNIKLAISSATNSGASLAGTFTEEITGLSAAKIVVSGPFVLVKPTASTVSTQLLPNANGCIDLTQIKAGGSDPNVVEYGDIAAAMHLFYNASIIPNLCAPREQTLNDALTSYYSSLP